MKNRILVCSFLAAIATIGLIIPSFNTKSASAVEVARPSNPGGPGAASTMTGNATAGAKIFTENCMSCHGKDGKGGVTNHGSTDGTVPPLNPIDETIVNKDPKVFAYNIDLFVQNGSTPEGPNPIIKMPAWGAKNFLNQKEIADVIAYIMSLNSAK